MQIDEKTIQTKIKEIFVPENITAITYYLQGLVTKGPRVQETEFLTLVHNAKVEGQLELIQKLAEEIN